MVEFELDATRELQERLMNSDITLEEYLEQSEKILNEMFPIEESASDDTSA